MNSRQLVLDTLEGRSAGRAVCGPLAVHFCARDMGIKIEDYSRDANLIAESVVRYYEKYRPDAIWISSDTWVTAEAMGAEVYSPGKDQPLAGTSEGVIKTAVDIDRIPPPDPHSQGRQPIMLEALRRVKQTVGDEVFIVGCFDQSPYSLACAVGGITQVMVQAISDPPFVEALLERCIQYATAYGQAMAEAGADMLSTGDSPAGLVGPQLYEELCLPAERCVFGSLRQSTDAKLSLHVCGDATALLSQMATSGADVLELDHVVDFETACRQLPEEIAIWGNLDPVKVLLQSTPSEVEAIAHQRLSQAAALNRRRFVLSSGCTLAPATPPENLHALIRATHNLVSEPAP